MNDFLPIDPSIDNNPNPIKKPRIGEVDKRISPPTVAISSSPSSLPQSVFSIDTDDYDTYTYIPPLENYQVTVDLKNGLYPEIGKSIEYYLGPKEYWINNIWRGW